MADLTFNPRFSVQNQDEGVLNASATATATSMTISSIKKWVNNVQTTGGFDSTAGFVKIIDSTGRYEFASFGAKSVDSNNITTISSMRRGLSPTSSGFAAGTGQVWDANTRIYVCDYAQLWRTQGPLFIDYTGATVGNSGVRTTLLGAGVGSLTIPANFMQLGTAIRFSQFGRYGTKAAATGSLQFRVYLAAGTYLESDLSPTASMSAVQYEIETTFICTGTGAGGTVTNYGQRITLHTSDTAASIWQTTAQAGVSSFDTTIANVMDIKVTWNTADSSNTITSVGTIIECIS